MIFSKKKKVLSAMLSLAMIGSMVASVPFTASADATTTTTTAAPGVSYSTQIQSIGWQAAVADGALSGTVNKAKRLEAIKINLTNAPGASITYKTQVQSFGWQAAVSDGAVSGTVGKAKRLETIKITLNGMPGYSVKYQVQGQSYGWQAAVSTENGTAIDSAASAGTVGLAKRLEAIKITIVKDPVTTLSVSKVAATSATTMAVTFNTAVTDTTKLAFAVKNSGSTALTTTTTWNSANTVATLTLGYSFPAGSYTVGVTNDKADLGTSPVTITAQQVAKITVTNTKLALALQTLTKTVSGNTTTVTPYWGYASYKVYDQYGNDITTTTLGSDLVWTTSVGYVSASKGVITVKPLTSDGLDTGTVTSPLSSFQTCSLSVYDTDDYVTGQASLAISSSCGVISSITLGAITSPNNDSFDTSDTAGTFYLGYTALDSDGNPTTNLQLLKAGIQSINTTSTYLTATLQADDTDSTKGVIKVGVVGATLYSDMQLSLTAILRNGTSSPATVTLKKAATLATFTMSAPSTTVAANDGTVTIPFTAFDQNSVAITSYSTLSNTANLTLNASTGTKDLYFARNSDGSATLKYKVPTTAQTVYLTTVVPTAGKTSQLSLTVNAPAYPTSLVIDSSVVKSYMEIGASQYLDFNVNNDYSGISCLDQYGRTISLGSTYSYKTSTSTTASTGFYRVLAVGDNVATSSDAAYQGKYIQINAASAASTAAVTFELQYDTTSNAFASPTTVDTKNMSFTTIESSSIVSAKSNAVDLLYGYDRTNTDGSAKAITAATATYNESMPTVYGVTSSGALVALKSTDLINGSASVTGSFAIDGTYHISATDGDDATSTGTLTQVVNVGGSVYPATATLNAKNDSPVAASIAASIATDAYSATTGVATTTGISISGNTITCASTDLNGNSLQQYTAAGVATIHNANLYLYAKDQYNETNPQAFTYFTLTRVTGTTAAIDATTGVITNVASGDEFSVSVVTKSGLTASYEFIIK
jgi:uncharacterized protein YjdB